MTNNEDIYAKWLDRVRNLEPAVPDKDRLESKIMSSLKDRQQKGSKRIYRITYSIKILSGIAASAVLYTMISGIYEENIPVHCTKTEMAFTDAIKTECGKDNVFDAYRCFLKEYAGNTPSYIKKYFEQNKYREL